MPNDTKLKQLIINVLSDEQFKESAKNPDEFYYVEDAESGGSGAGRNIGDVFLTTRTDNAVNGAVECNGMQYNVEDVNGGVNDIKDLLTSGSLPYKSYSEWQEIVDRDGGCDSFAWDGGATFKVPLKQERVVVRHQDMTQSATESYSCSYNVFSNGDVEHII